MTKLVGLLAFFCLILNINSQNVKVHFMDYSQSEWQAIESTVKTVIATKLTEYCNANNDCGVTRTNSANISADDLTFAGTKDSFTIDGRFAVVYISATVESQSISGNVLQAFMKEYRASIVEDSGAAIAFINDELVYPARDNTDNYVIISISSTVVLGLFILNIILTKKSNAKEEEVEKKKLGFARSKEAKPLLKNKDGDIEMSKVNEKSESVTKMTQSTKSISRSESFDQRPDAKLHPGKHRKRHKDGNSNSVIAGNIGSVIGSTRNLAEDEKWHNLNNVKNSQTADQINQNTQLHEKITHSMKNFASTEGAFKNVNSESADPKVAARLASNEHLL